MLCAMRFRAYLRWVAGVFLLLILTAHFTLRYAFNTPKFKAAATGFLHRATGRPANYDRIRCRLFPFSLEIGNPVLQEPDGHGEFASAPKITARLNLRAGEIAALGIEQPVIRIARHPDGSWNISDWFDQRPRTTPAAAAPAPPEKTSTRRAESPAAAASLIRRIEINNGRLEIGGLDSRQPQRVQTLRKVDFSIEDTSAAVPLQGRIRAQFGRSSTLEAELNAPPRQDYLKAPDRWPLTLRGQIHLGHPEDLGELWPALATPPLAGDAHFEIRGTPAEGGQLHLSVQVPPNLSGGLLEIAATLQAQFTLPAAAAEVQGEQDGPPAAPAAAEASAKELPFWQRLAAEGTLSSPRLAIGANILSNLFARWTLQEGRLLFEEIQARAYDGRLEARGDIQLGPAPIRWRLESFAGENLAVEKILAANAVEPLSAFSGRLHVQGRARGKHIGADALPAVLAEARLQLEPLQEICADGSRLDHFWQQLDHPLLKSLLPRLKPRIEEARQARGHVVTSRYETARARFVLQNAIVRLPEAELAQAGYRLTAAGSWRMADDHLQLTARLAIPPAETAAISGGRDLTAILPIEQGSLILPFYVRGPRRDPVIQPDFEQLFFRIRAPTSVPPAGTDGQNSAGSAASFSTLLQDLVPLLLPPNSK